MDYQFCCILRDNGFPQIMFLHAQCYATAGNPGGIAEEKRTLCTHFKGPARPITYEDGVVRIPSIEELLAACLDISGKPLSIECRIDQFTIHNNLLVSRPHYPTLQRALAEYWLTFKTI